MALFFRRLKGDENLDKHLDEVDIMLDELELLEEAVEEVLRPSVLPMLLPVIDDPVLPRTLPPTLSPKRRA